MIKYCDVNVIVIVVACSSNRQQVHVIADEGGV
jgi:hypothetical protein